MIINNSDKVKGVCGEEDGLVGEQGAELQDGDSDGEQLEEETVVSVDSFGVFLKEKSLGNGIGQGNVTGEEGVVDDERAEVGLVDSVT